MGVVLIVDEATATREALAAAVGELGHEVIVLDDGNQALEVMGQRPVDLVILDVVLPGLNGFQICRALRSQEATRGVPIIITTAMDREADRYWGLKQGADEYLIKPVDVALLAQKVTGFVAAGPAVGARP